MVKKDEKIFIQIHNEVIELKNDELKSFEAAREQMRLQSELVETEYKLKQETRQNAIKKLAEIAGLTDEEIEAIL